MKKIVALIGSIACLSCPLEALFPINIFQPYDIHLTPESVYGSCYDVMVGFEGSTSFNGFRDDQENFGKLFCNRGNVLQLYQDDISLLGLLSSVGSDPQAAKLFAKFMSDGLGATSS